MILTIDSTGPEIQFTAKTKGLSQTDMANHFEVNNSSISRAIKGEPQLRSLKKQIIDYINKYVGKK